MTVTVTLNGRWHCGQNTDEEELSHRPVYTQELVVDYWQTRPLNSSYSSGSVTYSVMFDSLQPHGL